MMVGCVFGRHVIRAVRAAGIALGAFTSAGAQMPAPTRCGVGIPASEASGYVPLPRGDVFCPLLADPKGQRSFVSYLRETDDEGATDLGSVGISDMFALLRIGGSKPGNGFQVSLAGSVFAQFDLESASYDLINADYIIGIPITIRRGVFSTRLRLYHQSSHLGDEFLLRTRTERVNLTYESVDLKLSYDLPWGFRAYAGGGYLFDQEPSDLQPWSVQGGMEFRSPWTVASGQIRPVAALDIKSHEQNGWNVDVSLRGGIQLENVRLFERNLQLLLEYYHGNSPDGQFFKRRVEYLGLGAHFHF